jgi:hypothetical protein
MTHWRCHVAEEKVIADLPAQQAQSENLDPTAGLLYAPSYPGTAHNKRLRRNRPRPVLSYRKSAQSNQTPAEPESDAEQGVEKMTLEDAFKLEIELGDPLNDERAVRAASFLLEWAAGEGNEEVDGILAVGISRALSLAASNMARTRRRNCKQAQESIE